MIYFILSDSVAHWLSDCLPVEWSWIQISTGLRVRLSLPERFAWLINPDRLSHVKVCQFI